MNKYIDKYTSVFKYCQTLSMAGRGQVAGTQIMTGLCITRVTSNGVNTFGCADNYIE